MVYHGIGRPYIAIYSQNKSKVTFNATGLVCVISKKTKKQKRHKKM